MTTTFSLARASDEQWGHELFSPVAGMPIIGKAPIQAMTVAPNGALIYAGASLDSDDGSASVVSFLNSRRTRLAERPTVYAIAIDKTNLYVGGDFKGMPGASANNLAAATNLARWDGVQWWPVGGNVSGVVRALAVKDGSLYVGGSITNAGSVLVNNIARWDGTNWSDLGGGVHQPNKSFQAVRALQFVGDRLYVGGNFDSAGSIAVSNIAELSEGQWKALAMGTNNGVSGPFPPVEVRAFATNTSGDLIVGGTFYKAGGIPANMVAKWNGSEWSALGQGLMRPSVGSVDALYCQGNEIYAGGSFIFADGGSMPTNQRGFAKWNGTNWRPVSSVLTREGITAITGDGTNVFVAAPLISPVVTGSPGPVGIIRVNSTNWGILGGGFDLNGNFAGIRAITTNATTLQVNSFPLSGNVRNVVEWDGAKWIADGAALSGTIEDLGYNSGITYAVGSLSGVVGGAGLRGIAGWNGTNWFYPGGLPSDGLVIAANGTNLYAGHKTGISKKDETGWTDVGNNLPGEVRAIAFDGDTIFAGGNFTANSPETITNVAQFSGDIWKPLGGGVNGTVRALAVVGHKLYAGGDFTEADGKRANYIAVWDGANWTEVGGGIANGIYATSVYAIEPDAAGGLFIVGDFKLAGDEPANFIAHWTGEHWEQLGTGLSGPAMALATKGEDLFAVGDFLRAGGHPSSQIARWSLSGITLAGLNIAQGTVSLEARGLVPKEFVLQKSNDLRTWQNVSTNVLTPPSVPLITNLDDTRMAFYRVIVTN